MLSWRNLECSAEAPPGSHRQPGSAEVLLGSSLLEQHPTALIETPLQGGARFRIHAANSES
jgi:hypothetical protein